MKGSGKRTAESGKWVQSGTRNARRENGHALPTSLLFPLSPFRFPPASFRRPLSAFRFLVAALALFVAGCGGAADDDAAGASTRDLTVVQLNFLHGITGMCPPLDNCRLADRATLLGQWIVRSGCPDLVILQEVWNGSLPLLAATAAEACPFAYEMALSADQLGPDEHLILSRHPMEIVTRLPLFPGFRKVLHARVDHPLGPIDVYTTHLASGSDGANIACDGPLSPCPAECRRAGAQTRRECQAVQMAELVAATHTGPAPAIITGDFNAEPGSFVYRQFTDRGWPDVYLAAGNAECDAAGGGGCTSGREDDALDDLEAPAPNVDRRIDFIFLVPPAAGFSCTLDPPDDADGDGLATRGFADLPNPFAPECGAAPLPICWPSDHTGVALDLNCE